VQTDRAHLSGIIIEDAGFNTMMRTIFNLAWYAAKK